MEIIENTKDLKAFCQKLNKQEFITVDLEFHREKSYYAQLGLIQVAYKGGEAVIDPLAPEIDLSSFYAILSNSNITKVFHSCRQDIEILYLLSGFIPTPVFDTQVAAQVCGLGSSISYENLVKHILKKDIDKSCRLTNWCTRPLDKQQVEYALGDVTYLVEIYEWEKQELKNNQREHWIDEEMAALLNPNTYTINPQDAWKKIKHHSHNSKYLTLLRDLAAWREIRAQEKNLPRQTIIKDESLLNIAAARPHSIEELGKVRNIRQDIVNGKLASEIVDIVNRAEQYSNEDYIKIIREKNTNNENKALYELLKLLLNIISQSEGVVGKLIASEEELQELSNGKNNRLLQGWRYEIFGQKALKLCSGKLSIKYEPLTKKINFIEKDSD